MAPVETDLRDGVLTITLCDVDRRNVLSRQLLTEMAEAIDVVDHELEVRVALVTNEGHVFCAGADLAERSVVPSNQGRTIELSELFQRIRNSPKPFVGALRGHCVAGGVGLAAVMDISIALDTSMFGFTEVRIGVAPAMISVVCLPKMRAADARASFLRGNRFSAAEAAHMGLINYAVPAEDFDRELNVIVNDLLAGEPHALAAAKSLTNAVPTMSTDEAFAWTTELSTGLFASEEAREGMRAFLEKRPAAWVRRIDPDSL